jgi:ribosome-associated toxin RatA of RatAB toxin-antitoxin module
LYKNGQSLQLVRAVQQFENVLPFLRSEPVQKKAGKEILSGLMAVLCRAAVITCRNAAE